MTGTFSPAIKAAITGVTGLAGPQGENQVVGATEVAGATSVAGVAMFTVPYNLQQGLMKYAPMQPIPGTKITAKNPTPLYPTSSYSIATAYLPLPTITITTTQSQTFSVSSAENTVSFAAKGKPIRTMLMSNPPGCRRSNQGPGRHGQLPQEMGRLDVFL